MKKEKRIDMYSQDITTAYKINTPQFKCLFDVPYRNFHSYWNIPSCRQHKFRPKLDTQVIHSSEGGNNCRDTGPPFSISYPRDPWFSLLNVDNFAKNNHYLCFIRLRFDKGMAWVGLQLIQCKHSTLSYHNQFAWHVKSPQSTSSAFKV